MTLSFLSFAAVIGWIPYRIDAPVEAKAPEAFTIWWAPQHGMSKRLGMLGGGALLGRRPNKNANQDNAVAAPNEQDEERKGITRRRPGGC